MSHDQSPLSIFFSSCDLFLQISKRQPGALLLSCLLAVLAFKAAANPHHAACRIAAAPLRVILFFFSSYAS
jgi:hypothetical protein